MDLEVINKLCLELSQIATVKTGADIALDLIRQRSDRRGKLLADIYNCDEAEHLPAALKARIGEELFLTLPERNNT